MPLLWAAILQPLQIILMQKLLIDECLSMDGERNRQGADWAEVSLRPIVSLTVQSFVLELCRTLLAYLLVLLAVGLLAVHAAVFDEAAGGAVLELDAFSPFLSAVGADFNGNVTHFCLECVATGQGARRACAPRKVWSEGVMDAMLDGVGLTGTGRAGRRYRRGRRSGEGGRLRFRDESGPT